MKEVAVIIPNKLHQDIVADHPLYRIFADNGMAVLLTAYVHAKNNIVRRINPELQNGMAITETDEAGLGSLLEKLADPTVKAFLRVRKTATGFTAFLPAATTFPALFDLFPNFRLLTGKEIEDAVEKVLPGFTNPTEPLDVFFGKELIAGFENDPNAVDYDEDLVDQVATGITGFRLVMQPADHVNLREDWRADAYGYRASLGALLNRRAVLFASFNIPEKMAEFITQERGDGIRVSQIAEFLSRIQSNLFEPSRQKQEFVPHIISVTAIEKDNRESDVIVEPATNEKGLTITRSGEIMWLPGKKMSPEFVENTIEAGGTQPDGDWTAADAINPKQTEYHVENGVRRRIDRGQNRIVYVDWNLGKLSYTDETARIRIMDITANRKVQPMHVLRYMDTRLDDASPATVAVLNGLIFATRVAKKIGVVFPQQTADTFVSERFLSFMTEKFNEGAIVAVLDTIISQVNSAINSRQSATGAELTAEEYQKGQAFLAMPKNMRMISPDSPVAFIRGMYEFFSEILKKAQNDPDTVFGEFSVLNSLKFVGALTILVDYAKEYDDVVAEDAEERKPYKNPDLDPVDNIQLPKIPLVAGTVELMPHQSKVMNYLKNFPRKLVLEVDAGGGKTAIALLYASMLLGAGKAKKILIACPGNLVSNYYTDAGWVFGGRMNLINISTSVMESKNWGEEKIRQLIEAAPPNTMFITDYDFLAPSAKSKSIVKFVYGNERVKISTNTQFIRSYKWDLVIYDEAHLLKTVGGNRNIEMTRIAANAKYLVEMSGTYVSDSLSDLVGAFGIIDPQTFGSPEQFADMYLTNGPKSLPIEGAQKQIRAAMAESCMNLRVSRKEWNALLPRRFDSFYPVEMTTAQTLVYLAILKETREVIERAFEDNPFLKNAFKIKKKKGANEEVDEDAADAEEEDGTSLDDLLNGPVAMYLQRLEQFLTAPSADPMGKNLTGKDAISPKLAKVEELIREHREQKRPGKIMVWTQYVASAAHIYDSMSEDLRKHAVLYTAAQSAKVLAQFEKDPNIYILVGCEKSINTGQNLQFASHLIRLETVWNYGTLEQGESRINRPSRNDPRKEENGGNGIFYSWVFCNKSIDVTKNARMFSKLISTVKYNEAIGEDAAAYSMIDEPPPIKLNKANLLSSNDWRSEEGCERYFQAYDQYQRVQEKSYKAFRENPKNQIEPYTMENGPIPKGSGLLVNVPYVPRMQIYNADQLGLVPFIEYVSTKKNKQGIILNEDLDWTPEDLNIHCEYGDCVAVDYNTTQNGQPQSIRVITPDGSRASVPLTAAWVITKTVSKSSDIRKAFAEMVGADVGNPVTPKVVKRLNPLEKDAQQQDEEVKPNKVRDVGRGPINKRGRLPEKDPKGKNGFELFVVSFDNYPALVVDANNKQVKSNIDALEGFGFMPSLPYRSTPIRTPRVLKAWLAALKAAKIEIAPAYKELLETDLSLLMQHKNLLQVMQGMAKSFRPNFFRKELKPAPAGQIKPYLFVDNATQVYLCLNQKANAATMSRVVSLEVPGITWSPVVKGELAAFFKTKKEMESTMKDVLANFPIENAREVAQDFAKLRVFSTPKK